MQPLAGIRIIDLTRLLPGPWATMLLGDLGADVIKIENPNGGDASRHAEPFHPAEAGAQSVYFCNANRNKRSVALDLKSERGRAALLAMVREADVVVENFKPGTAEKLGVGYATLKEGNPRLIYCAMTGYGLTGSLARLAGHDLNIAGMSGLLQRSCDDVPSMPIMLMGDYAGGAMVVTGILAALVDRERNGRGSFVEVSMLDALISWTTVQMTRSFAAITGAKESGAIAGWGDNPRYNIYRTRDGRYVTASLLEKKYWDAFCRLNGRPDLINPHETEADRLTPHGERGPAYRAFLEETFLKKDRDVWAREMRAAEIPVCPVLTPEELPSTEQAHERGHFLEVASSGSSRSIPQIGFPFRMTSSDGTAAFALRHGPPSLGEADGEFLSSLSDGRVKVS